MKNILIVVLVTILGFAAGFALSQFSQSDSNKHVEVNSVEQIIPVSELQDDDATADIPNTTIELRSVEEEFRHDTSNCENIEQIFAQIRESGLSRFNDDSLTPDRSGGLASCYQQRLGSEIVVQVSIACGGCLEWYVLDKTGSWVLHKTAVPLTFGAVLYHPTEVTPFYLGVSSNEVYRYDVATNTKIPLYQASANERLLWCEYGCTAQTATITVRDNQRYLNIMVYPVIQDESPSGYVNAYNQGKMTAIQI